MRSAQDFSFIYTTIDSFEAAQHLALVLVDERLAACANIFSPMTSIYRWEGKTQQTSEIGILFKTASQNNKKLMERIKTLHPYECPCIVSWRLQEADPDYLAWLHQALEKIEAPGGSLYPNKGL